MADAGRGCRLSDGRLVQPSLLSGLLAEHRAALSAGGARVFAPCGASVFCFSAKTARQICCLQPAHGSRVTAVCAGPRCSAKGCSEPLVSGSASGEVRVWDAKAAALLGSLDLQRPVYALRWPREDTVLVAVGEEDHAVRVCRIQVSELGAPALGSEVPLEAERGGAFDAAAGAAALSDGNDVLVWKEGWAESQLLQHEHRVTALSVDPQGRCVVVGDERGVVWTWWNVFDTESGDSAHVPARWHWHANPVRSLAHCGPVVLSGGDEGVLVVRGQDDGAEKFIPRFPASLRHIAASADGRHVCLSLEDNSLALVDDLHGWVRPRMIHAVDVPIRSPGQDRQARATLHPLGNGSLALTASGRRVQFLDDQGRPDPSRATLSLDEGGRARSALGSSSQVWHLSQIACGPGCKSIMTCESRTYPATRRADEKSARSFAVKWWRLREDNQFILDSVSHSAHEADITVALAHPSRETYFLTASLDGSFKCWDVPAEGRDGEQRCWQCVATGDWRGLPVQSGCFVADGSVFALGVCGFVVLWELETATELRMLPLSEVTDRPTQLFSAVACGRPLLLASTRGRDKKEQLVCWDLCLLTVLARTELVNASKTSKAKGASCSMVRALPPQGGAGDEWRLLSFQQEGTDVQAWRLAPAEGGAGLAFHRHTVMTLPPGQQVLDCHYFGSGSRLMCWTSRHELWGLDVAPGAGAGRGREEPAEQGALGDEEEPVRGKIAKVFGDGIEGAKAPAADTPPKLLALPTRTTAAQQAGVVPRFLDRVVPPHMPSHQLPPPPVIWASFLAVFGKWLPDAKAAAATSPGPDAREAGGGEEPSGGPGLGALSDELPPWLSADSVRQKGAAAPELVDADWMDKLVEEALAK